MKRNELTHTTCKSCHQETDVVMYFSGMKITTTQNPSSFYGDEYYTAIANGKAICPHCGQTIEAVFHRQIKTEAILELAVGD